MIDFACKRFNINEIVKCSLGLSKSDFKLLQHMLKAERGPVTTDHLAKRLDVNLTTAQRSVKRLHEKGVLKRTQLNLDGGGYVFRYEVKDRKQVAQLIISIVHGWTRRVETELHTW
jgi:predicted transcriptional regulator